MKSALIGRPAADGAQHSAMGGATMAVIQQTLTLALADCLPRFCLAAGCCCSTGSSAPNCPQPDMPKSSSSSLASADCPTASLSPSDMKLSIACSHKGEHEARTPASTIAQCVSRLAATFQCPRHGVGAPSSGDGASLQLP